MALSWLSQTRGLATTTAPSEQQEPVAVVRSLSSRQLAQRTHEWLSNNETDDPKIRLSIARSLLEQWLSSGALTASIWCTRILSAWMDSSHPTVPPPAEEVLEWMHRVLFQWRRYSSRGSITDVTIAADEALGLWEGFQAYHCDDNASLPLDKATSMVLELLGDAASHKDAFTRLEQAKEILDSTQQQSRPDLGVWNAYLHVLAKASPTISTAAEQAQSILFESLPRHQVEPDQKTVATVLQAWAVHADAVTGAPRAQDLLERLQQEQPHLVTTVSYNICLQAWARAGQPERAQALLERLLWQERDLQPDTLSYQATIQAWGRWSDKNEAATKVQWLLQHLEDQHQKTPLDSSTRAAAPTTALYTSAMHVLQDDAVALERLLHRMQERHDVPPSAVTYTVAMQAWAKHGSPDAPERARALLDRLLLLYQDSNNDPTLAPCAIAYTTLVQAYVKSARENAPEQALQILDEMDDLAVGNPRVAPTRVTYNAVLAAFAKAGRTKEAEELLREMKDRAARGDTQLQPDRISYSTVLTAYRASVDATAGQKVDALLEEMEEAAENGHDFAAPTVDTYIAAIMAHTSGSQAQAVLWRMVERFESGASRVRPTTAVCNAVLQVWSRNDEAVAPERAQGLLEWMMEQPTEAAVQPDRTTLHAMLQIWAQSKRRSAIPHMERLLTDLPRKYPDLALLDRQSYNQLLFATKKSPLADKATRAAKVLEKMQAHGIRPNLTSFHHVLDACAGRSADAAQARRILVHTIERLLDDSDLEWTNKTFFTICRAMDRLDCMSGGEEHAALLERVVKKCMDSAVVDEAVVQAFARILPEEQFQGLRRSL